MQTISPDQGERADFPNLGTRYLLRDEEARLLELISPPAFASYFVEMAPVLSADGPPDIERLGAIQRKYGLSMDPESRGRLMEEHGLER